MHMDNKAVGEQIARLRAAKGITQNELGARVGVSFQAVSKWERGETLPDVAILPDLAEILETTIDNILLAGTQRAAFRGRIRVQDMIEGVLCLKKMGELLGQENILYRCAVQGIDSGMNTQIEAAFTDDHCFEAFVAEAILANLKAGFYVDLTDVKRNFKHAHFRDLVCEYVLKYGIV